MPAPEFVSNVYRKSPKLIVCSRVSPGFDKCFYRFKVAVTGRPMKWCIASRFLHVVSGTNRQEILYNLSVTPGSSPEQCSFANGVCPVHVSARFN